MRNSRREDDSKKRLGAVGVPQEQNKGRSSPIRNGGRDSVRSNRTLRLDHSQVVGDVQYIVNLVHAYSAEILVGFRVHNSEQSHSCILDDDANRRIRHVGVLEQGPVGINRLRTCSRMLISSWPGGSTSILLMTLSTPSTFFTALSASGFRLERSTWPVRVTVRPAVDIRCCRRRRSQPA